MKEACQLWETYSMAAVGICEVRMKPLVTHIIVSNVGEAVFMRPRPRQHWRGEAAENQAEAEARQAENHINVLN